MTIIVWDGKTLAADRQATCGNLARSMRKISRYGDILIGGAGTRSAVDAVMNWVLKGCVAQDFPKLSSVPAERDVSLWVINKNGTIRKFEDSPFPMVYDDNVFAEGSGRDFAYGAMAMGANAIQAVEIACRFDVTCGGGVDVLTFEDQGSVRVVGGSGDRQDVAAHMHLRLLAPTHEWPR
jgi:ATP-dependent protease HslVU (ClpYQ) peptidase subunit